MWRKYVPKVLSALQGLWQRVILKTKGHTQDQAQLFPPIEWPSPTFFNCGISFSCLAVEKILDYGF